jgi:hypothetical protein
MVDLEKLAAVAEGSELPPTVRDAVQALVEAWRLDVVEPPEGCQSAVPPGSYVLVAVR